MFKYKNTYGAIASFGCMCSLARFLEDNGFRCKSSFFDWIDSSFKTNVELLENSFADVLKKEYLIQKYADSPNVVTNTKYNFSFVHLFDVYQTFEKQINTSKEKVKKMIQNFNAMKQDGLLLIYYCRDFDEQKWLLSNENYILDFCSKHKIGIAFIFNFPVNDNFLFKYFVIKQNNTHKPFGGGVSAPFTDAGDIMIWLTSKVDESYMKKNFDFLKKKNTIIQKIKKLVSKIKRLRKKKLLLDR